MPADGRIAAYRRRTKLVCTLGPAVADRIDELVAAGMDVARLNFSHGTPEQRRIQAGSVRAAAAAAGRPVAVLADLAGPKIRIGELRGGTAELAAGGRFDLRNREEGRGADGDGSGAVVSYDRLPEDVRAGDTILLGDGVAELRAETVERDRVTTTVVRGGTIRSRTGVAIPSERLSFGGLTNKDRVDARDAIDMGTDYVAQSFVRTRADVLALRELLGPGGPPLVAKIETRPAIDGFDGILDVVDAVMVARGDLGVELPYEEVPIVQKQLVRRALDRGVPTIVATQMLESMLSSPRPTRAEASDVANAVFDGADAIMLSGETAIGRYPILAAEAAVRIARLCEERGREYLPPGAPPPLESDAGSLAYAAVALADADEEVAAIACYTSSGRTARLLSALRPRTPILAWSPDPATVARLALVHGVVPKPLPEPVPLTERLAALERALVTPAVAGPAQPAGPPLPAGAAVVLLASTTLDAPAPNLLALHRLPS